VDEVTVASWLERYIAAWRSYDVDEIGALFADDAVYRYHPWDEGAEAVQGREAIVASWLEAPDAPGSWVAEYRPWTVEDDRAVAVGVSRYLATDDVPEAVFHNVFLLRFDDEGRCGEFTDVYMRRPDRG
jgi:ketosteroid isomerase-like protein